MRISVILKHVSKKFPNNDLIAGLAVPPPRENLTFGVNNTSISAETKFEQLVSDTSRGTIHISVPVNTLSADHSIEISLSSKDAKTEQGVATEIRSTAPANEFLLEVAKETKEKEVDFNNCQGYDPMFLGVPVPMPQPKKAIKKQIARLQNKEIELKYFKYSVIFNAVTKMPLISAINVEGDASKRLDNSKRSDDWLRDTRIDPECQLTDKFYAKSNFDKGHMSRFEDANWDDSEAAALRNGVYTCFYTNACPQVGDLNRAGGLWGKLEKAILEKGVKKETDKKEARMIVFNGPIFNDDKDRIFKGVKIPMEFFKVIVWLNDDGKPRATAFKLSQETLVDDVKFDESMRLDQEALDIDKDVLFKNYQCSLKHLGKLTKIDFKALERFDTFIASEDDECFIDHVESLVL
jgi:endonuclease G